MSSESVSRTFIGSVVCVDLVGYSTRPVTEQIAVKDAFNRLLAGALKRVPEEDRIILDTGDGAAISFLGDPEVSLSVGLALRDAAQSHAGDLGARPGEGAVRIGINLGSVKLALDLNGYPRIVGDGINVAERITAFANPGEIVVSRSFFEMVSRLSEANTKLFRHEGTRTDKNGREHHIYAVKRPGEPDELEPGAAAASGTTSRTEGALTGFLRDRFKVGFAAALLLALIAAEAMILVRSPSGAVPPIAAAPPSVPAAEPVAAAPPPAKAVAAPTPAPVVAASKPAVTEAPKAEPPKVEPRIEPPKIEPPKAAAVKADPAKPETPKAETPKPADGKAPAKYDPKPVEAKPARRDDTTKEAKAAAARKADEAKAAAAPAIPEPKPAPPPAPAPPAEEPKPAPTLAATPLSRASVSFPPAAAAKNIESGTVKARLSINAAGAVTGVQILEARPRRYFDEEATRSLREWRFNPGAENRTYEVEIAFQR